MGGKMDRRAFATGALGALMTAGAGGAAWAQASRFGTLARRESQYATTYVDRRSDGLLSMTFGINECLFVESLYNPDDPSELPVTYTQFMTVALAYTAQARQILEIGLGGGRIASYLHDFLPNARITCAELDPGVIELAQSHFGVTPGPRLRLVQQDGRIYARRTNESFDIILVDAYQGTLVPFHLVTREFFAVLKQKLQPGGVVAQNISPDVLNRDDIVATLRSVFANTEIFRAGGNWVLVAYDGPRKTPEALLARADALQSAHDLRYPLAPMLARRTLISASSGARVYTDDFAPVGYHDRDRECRAGGRR